MQPLIMCLIAPVPFVLASQNVTLIKWQRLGLKSETNAEVP